MRRLFILAFLIIPSFSFLRASEIDYTITGEMSGAFFPTCSECSSISFSDVDFTFDFTGDTAGVFDISPTILGNPVLSSSFTIGAFTGAFTDSLEMFAKDSEAGFSDLATTDGLSIGNPALLGYGLATDIGPVSNTSAGTNTETSPGTQVFNTTLGELEETKVSELTFTATVETASTPEPAYTGLIGIFAIAAAVLYRRRARITA
jgi:hypothetical protein